MKYFILLAFLASLNTYAQEIQLIDQKSKAPISDASISSNQPKAFAVSDENGKVNLSPFKGAKTISIRSLGYATYVTSYDSLNQAPYKVELVSSHFQLDEVVISSRKWKQNNSNIPQKITKISPKDVAFNNPQTAADLLAVSGEVFIQKSQQGGGSPMIRGFATNRLLYSIDGVRMNTAIFRGGNLQNVISLDPFAMESTEVLFGPASVTYGSDAIGGVMSFTTLQPEFSTTEEPLIKGNAVARYSSANQEQTAHVDLNVGWKKWAMVSSISHNDYDHLRQGTHGPDDYLRPFHVERIDSLDRIVDQEDELLQRPTAYRQTNLMHKVRFQANENLELNYGFHYSETSAYGRFDRHQRLRNGAPRYGRWDYGPQEWMMNQFSLKHTKSNKLYDELQLTMAIQAFEESRIQRDFNSNSERNQIEKVDAYSVNLDFSKQLSEKHRLFYGLEGILNDVTSKGFSRDIISENRSPVNSRYPQSEWSSYAVYLSNQYLLSKKLTLQAGVRLNTYQIDARFDTSLFNLPFNRAELENEALTGSIGATFRPSSSWVIKASAATAFRAPNVDDIGKVFDSEPGAVVVPNQNLEAETSYTFDLGIAKTFGDFLKLDLTAFYTRLEDALVRRDFQLNNRDSIEFGGQLSQVQAIQNAAFAEVYGVQIGWEAYFLKNFSFSADFNYQRGDEELDNGETSRSRHAAPFFGRAALSFEQKSVRWEVSFNYQGKRKFEDLPESEKRKTEFYALDENGNPFSPDWYTINIRTMFPINEKLTVSGGIENISDQRYRPYSSGISAPGRNFVFSLRSKF